MKRDIRINYIKIEDLSNKLENYKIALEDVEDSMEDLKAFLQEQESEAVEGLLEKISDVNVDTTKKCSMIEEIMTTINGFVSEMRSYIKPVSDDTNVRVDRDDIYFNLTQIRTRKGLLNSSVKKSVRGAYHPCIGSDADAINKKNRYERNYNKVENIRTTQLVPLISTIESEIDGMFSIYDNNIVPFENCDDAWKRIINDVYKDYTSFKERVAYTWSKIDDAIYKVVNDSVKACIVTFWVITHSRLLLCGPNAIGCVTLCSDPEEYVPFFMMPTKERLKIYGAMMIMSDTSIFGLDDVDIDYHYENNIIMWEKYKGDYLDSEGIYIEHQNKMNTIAYGNYSFISTMLNMESHNGAIAGSENVCEVIAVYNSLIYLNGKDNLDDKYSFPEILRTFEKRGISEYGSFGTNPIAIKDFFLDNEYETKMLVGSELTEKSIDNLSDNYSVFIVTVYNDKDDITKGIHTMSVTPTYVDGNKKYVIHNDYKTYGTEYYETLYDAIIDYKGNQNELIDIIGVNN